MKRAVILTLVAAIVIGLAGPFVPVNVFRPRLERALERGLGRRVEIGQVHFTLFPVPGLTLDDVTIHEDPRAGIEPFAYVQTLETRPRLLGLIFRRLEFSSLNLGDANINLVKTEAGPWNFQFLLGSAPANVGAMPAIKMRGGRVNFKFGDTKSVFYFNDADLDVSPYGDGAAELRFSGAPSRSDRSAQDFGHFFVRGRSLMQGGEQRLDMRVELEPSALEEVARLMDRQGFGVQGSVSLEAQLSGSPSHLDVLGQLHIADLRRWDLPPQRGAWSVGYKGTLDLRGERLELQEASGQSNPPMALQARVWDFLSRPHWDAFAELRNIPLASAFDLARRLGTVLPEKLMAEGSVSGSLRYSETDGLAGSVEMHDAVLTLPDAGALRVERAAALIDHQAVVFGPATVRVGEDESAEIEGNYSLAGAALNSGELDVKVSTKGMNVADVRSLGLGTVPLFDRVLQGKWRGSARYHWPPHASATAGAADDEPEANGNWSGDYQLQNAQISVDGLADPVKVASAAVSLKDGAVAVSRLKAEIGEIEFTGDYRWDPSAVQQHKFHIAIQEADAAEVARLFAPTLARDRGFLARALRLRGPTPLPDWLEDETGDGSVQVETLSAADWKVRNFTARVLWDDGLVKLAGLSARLEQGTLAGGAQIDLAGPSPHYGFVGKLQDIAYKGGRLDFDGSLEAEGTGTQVLRTVHGAGSFSGRAIAFGQDMDFRTVIGCFELAGSVNGARWKVRELEVVQNGDSYTGQATAQADGRVLFELSSGGKKLRYNGSLFAMIPPP
jgi:hypothetical protein